MKKILNWIVVIVVAFIITGLVCRAKIYDGMTEIKHIYNGMTPIYSIYDGPGSATGASNITFSLTSGTYWGTSSVMNVDLTNIIFEIRDFSSGRLQYRYTPYFSLNFLKMKTPIQMIVDGNTYSLTYSSVDANSSFFTPVIPLSDRVSATSLTKAIDFNLVDNAVITGLDQPDNNRFVFSLPSGFPTVAFPFEYKYGGRPYSVTGSAPTPHWFVCFTSDLVKNATYFIINGRSFILSSATDDSNNKCYWTQRITDTNFQVSSTNLEFGINILFSDGTYANNTRSKLFARTIPVQIYRRPVVPVITSFSVTPTTIDLDDRLTGTISFSLGVTGTSNQVTTARIIRVRDNAQIGTTFTGGSGLNLSQTLPNITQPLRTETYRLIATNTDGNSHRDATVTVTKNPTLTNCRRTNVIARVGFTNYTFGFSFTGLPRPVVTYRFSGGRTGTVPSNHYTQGSNPYSFTASNWVVTMPNSNAQSLTLTATNSSGSATCTIGNIND